MGKGPKGSKGSKKGSKGPRKGSNGRRGQSLLGQPLVEILSLWIDNEDVADLHGVVNVSSNQEQRVKLWFPVEREKKLKIDNFRRRGGNHDLDASSAGKSRSESAEAKRSVYARLYGPNRAITATDFFSMNLELDGEGRVPSPRPHFPWVCWSSYESDMCRSDYDVPQFAEISCKHGKVTLKYVVIEDATELYMQTFLRSEKFPANIYGKITAETTFGPIEIFEKGSGEDIEVRPEVRIPLSRRVISVPMDEEFTVTANIQEKNSDLHIARGSAKLYPRAYQTTKAFFKGAHGEIEVKFTWLPFGWNKSKGIDEEIDSEIHSLDSEYADFLATKKL